MYNKNVFSQYDADVVQSTMNWYASGAQGMPNIPAQSESQQYTDESESSGFTLPEGWWIMALIGITINIIFYFLLNRSK